MRVLAASLLLLVGCSPGTRELPPREFVQEVVAPPETSVFIGMATAADSALPAARVRGGRRSALFEGQVRSPCRDHEPFVFTDYGSDRLAVEVRTSVPGLCFPRWETHTYTAIIQNLQAGRYPVEVRLHVSSQAPGIPSSTQVVLRDTIRVIE